MLRARMAYGMPWLLLEVKSNLVHFDFLSRNLKKFMGHGMFQKNMYVWMYDHHDFLIHSYFLTVNSKPQKT